jgi:hypothetical protein
MNSLGYYKNKNDLNKSDYDPNENEVFISNNEHKQNQITSIFSNLYRQISNQTDEITYNKNEIKRSVSRQISTVIIEKQGGLANRFVILLLILWYMCSALTLYTNKYIITTRKIDPTLIGKK